LSIDLNRLSLLSIDVGYSRRRPTTGVAWSIQGNIQSFRTHTDAASRMATLPGDTQRFDLIAVDGPLAPRGTPSTHYRACERRFVTGAFQKRCKPGLSHSGEGKNLRLAGLQCADQFEHLTEIGPKTAHIPQVFPGRAIVEAFPNAFIGVLIEDETYAAGGWKKRRKFDWLYYQAVKLGCFWRLVGCLGWRNSQLELQLSQERDHEKRAALVCLLTAACAITSKSTFVGDDSGGWFCLPPIQLWAAWATDAIST